MTTAHHLAHDLDTLMRRRALRWLAAGGVAPLALLGCGGGGDASTDASDGTDTGGSGSCAVIPEETAGPYPGDGSNSTASGVVNALALSGIERSDITTSIAGATGTAEGVPLTVTLTLVDVNAGCASLAGHAVYLWHCDREGGYSMYSPGVTDQNYLRGVQVSDVNGEVRFTTIFPACYAGRWPHIHFEVYASLAAATSAVNKIRTSQIALPDDACNAVYATDGYSASITNFSQVRLATDTVFSDGATLETPALSGSANAGYTITMDVGIAA